MTDIQAAQMMHEIALGFGGGILLTVALDMFFMGVAAFVDISKHIVKRCKAALGDGA